MHKNARFNVQEARTYHEGYYWGATYALRVVVEAIRRLEEIDKLQRQERRRNRSVKCDRLEPRRSNRRAG
jgi:hypothetical protein